MSLETGKQLGLVSSLMLVIVPIISVSLLTTFILASISAAFSNLSGATNAAVPALFGTVFGWAIIILAILGIIAVIILIAAMYNLSNYYKDPSIFKNVLYAFVINLGTIIVVLAIEFAILIPSLPISRTPTSPPTSVLSGYIIAIIVISIVAIAMGIVSSVLVMRAFNKLGERSEVDNFKTAGLLYLIGTVLSIVIIGGIIVWIAFIFAALGFNRLKPVTVYTPEAASPAMTMQTKRCPNCSTENRIDATYCRFCGKPLD